MHGDFGPSFKYKDFTVTELIAGGFPVSLRLGGSPCCSRSSSASRVGTLAALRQNTAADYAVMGAAMTGISIPNFVVAPLLILVFGLWLAWLPVGGWDGSVAIHGPAGRRARAAADRLHRAADARQHDRGAAQRIISARRAPRACPSGSHHCGTRSRRRCCRSSPISGRRSPASSPARSSSSRSSACPASAATSCRRRSTATTRW